jgi:hypothetical protein
MPVFFSQARRWSLRSTLLLLGLLALLTLFGAPSPASAQTNHPLSGGGLIRLSVQATQANLRGAYVYIDDPLLNGDSLAILLVTQYWNITGQQIGVYNNHPIGVWYDPTFGEWTIFNEDGASIPLGAGFQIVGAASSNTAFQLGGFFYQSSAANTNYDYSDLNDTISNGTPNAIVFVTETSTVFGRTSGCLCAHPLGVWYNSSTSCWSVFNEDETTMNANETFNVLVLPGPTSDPSGDWAVSVVTSSSVLDPPGGDWMYVPGATFPFTTFVTPNWNPPGQCCTYHNHTLGVWYNTSSGQWAVFNEDVNTMPLGVSFNLLVFTGGRP